MKQETRDAAARSMGMQASAADRYGLTPVQAIEVQMAFVVPLLRDLQEILGEQAVIEALEERNRRRLEATRLTSRGNLRVKDAQILRDFEYPAQGGALEYIARAIDEDTAEVDVSYCRMAELMQDMDAAELGYLLLCSGDYAAAARAGLQLDRPQTRMQGADHCAFRFSSAARETAPGQPED